MYFLNENLRPTTFQKIFLISLCSVNNTNTYINKTKVPTTSQHLLRAVRS